MAEVNTLQALGTSLKIDLPDNIWQRQHETWVIILRILFLFPYVVKLVGNWVTTRVRTPFTM